MVGDYFRLYQEKMSENKGASISGLKRTSDTPVCSDTIAGCQNTASINQQYFCQIH